MNFLKKSLLLSTCLLCELHGTWAMEDYPHEEGHIIYREGRANFERDASDTVIENLSKNAGPTFKNGEFPFEKDQSIDVSYTRFCPPMKEIGQAQKILSSSPPLPPFYVKVTDDGRCQMEREPLNKQETILKPDHDGRVRITQTDELPYSFQGHMIMTYPNGKQYLGSGVLVSPHHVLTAAHNIYSHKIGEGWASEVLFIPAQDEDKRPFDQARGAMLLSFRQWKETQDPAHDLALIVLDEPIGYRTGWAGIFLAPDDLLKQKEVHVTGYPGDKGKGSKNSTQMWTMSNRIKEVHPERLYYDIDTYPGQSGSAVWTTWEGHEGYYVLGIHAYGENTQGEGNTATRITPSKFKHILWWMREYQFKNFIHPGLPNAEEKEGRAQKPIQVPSQGRRSCCSI